MHHNDQGRWPVSAVHRVTRRRSRPVFRPRLRRRRTFIAVAYVGAFGAVGAALFATVSDIQEDESRVPAVHVENGPPIAGDEGREPR